jgi:hypothetical protein
MVATKGSVAGVKRMNDESHDAPAPAKDARGTTNGAVTATKGSVGDAKRMNAESHAAPTPVNDAMPSSRGLLRLGLGSLAMAPLPAAAARPTDAVAEVAVGSAGGPSYWADE